MASKRLSIPIGLILLLGGCASSAKLGVSRGVTVVAGSYDCRVSDGQSEVRPAAPRRVSVHPALDGSTLTLEVSRRRSEVLQPLSESAGHVFVGATYAWRSGDPVSTLTNLTTIMTYDCRPATDRVAAR